MSKRAKAKQLSKDRLKCNKPKKTPSHKTKSHVVKACKDGKEKIIRFGQQGVKGAGKNPKSEKDKARKKEIVIARQVAMYFSKDFTNNSLKSIGFHFGGRDHSTVIHAVQSVNDMIDTDNIFRKNVEEIKKRISI